MIVRNHPDKGPMRTRVLDVAIPAQYKLRTNRADTVGCCAGGALFLVLWLAFQWKPPAGSPNEIWVGKVFFLILMAACLLLALKGFRFSLDVDGEQITLRRWLRPSLLFTFSDLHYLQPRRGGYVLWSREGRSLCRLPYNLHHLDILQADLRSRGAAFQRKAPPVPTVLAPGPRQAAESLELPAEVPAHYRLGAMKGPQGIFVFGALFFAGCIAFCFWSEGLCPELFLLLPFLAFCLPPLVLSRGMELEVEGSFLRSRGARGKTAEFSFSDIAMVQIRNVATGFGPVSLLRLLDRDGNILAAPDPSLRNIQTLLADLIDRGIPFTY